MGRNTASALTLAALQATAAGDDPILVVTPADQTVTDTVAFGNALLNAIRVAATDVIVTLGITPDRPEVGYGYIKILPGLDAGNGMILPRFHGHFTKRLFSFKSFRLR